MTCREVIAVLCDFLDMTLGADVVADLERHLEGCEPCRAYLNTYKKTRMLTHQAGQAEMPAEMKQRLRAFVLEQLARRGPDSASGL